jgi:Neuraminidase (sialidase)
MRKLGEEFGNPGRCTLYYSYVYYSDDEGETWTRSRNETMVMLERGFAGSYAMGEPQVVELNDGRLLMFGRTNIGRIFKSYSPDRGHTWLEAEPTDLALTPSPSPLRRLPKTGDLLVIWNQTSRWENMIGLYRHRLSCAISKDEGETWQHHKNLESLDDTTRVEVDGFETLVSGGYRQPLDRVRYHRAPAPLRFNQPTCCFLDDKVIITYGMCVWGDKPVITETYRMDYDELMRKAGLAPYDRGNKVRVLSTDWFYG